MPPVKMMAMIMSDVLRNALTGFYEPEKPTSEARTEARRHNIIRACEELLQAFVGPSDLLDSRVRAEFAKEAYYGAGTCTCAADATCLRDPTYFAKYNQNDIEHQYASNSPFRDVAHAIVNHQERIKNVEFFDTFVERISKEYPKHYGRDEWRSMAIELGVIAACCVGVRDFCFAAGIDQIPLPEHTTAEPQPAYFKSVSDYSTGPLQSNKDIYWGPVLGTLKEEVKERFQFDHKLWNFSQHDTGPTSKASAAPTTCMAWLKFMTVMYMTLGKAAGFFRVPAEDRTLTRAQLEIAAAEFNGAKACNF
uniref:Uncharacterized protein n=1 Tax=Pseudictyota dubia TaxID=2749911 RepID=A0A7R9WJZ0_9STRA